MEKEKIIILTSNSSINNELMYLNNYFDVLNISSVEDFKNEINSKFYNAILIDVLYDKLDDAISIKQQSRIKYVPLIAVTENLNKDIIRNYDYKEVIVTTEDKELTIKRLKIIISMVKTIANIRKQFEHLQKTYGDAISYNKDMMSFFNIDFTSNVVINGNSVWFPNLKVNSDKSISDVFNLYKDGIKNKKELNNFNEIFDHQKIMSIDVNTSKTLKLNHHFLTPDGVVKYLSSNLYIAKNQYGQVSGVAYIYDLTNEYIEKLINKKLVVKKYDLVGIIDVLTRKIRIIHLSDSINQQFSTMLNQYFSFEDIVTLGGNSHVLDEEKTRFSNMVKFDRITSILQDNDEYAFSVKCKDILGNIRYEKFEYLYVDESKGEIIFLLSDTTTLLKNDYQTGAYSQIGFEIETQKILHKYKDRKYSLVYLDITQFKGITELLGEVITDEILKVMPTEVIAKNFDCELIAHLSSDFYVFLINNENLKNDLLKDKFNLNIKEREIAISVKYGIYTITDIDESVKTMLTKAQLAAEYVASLKECYAYFSESIELQYKMAALSSLNFSNACKEHQFKVYYQPIYDTFTGEIVSAEALIRWIHPTLGFISPINFIPYLERTGEITDLDYYVVENCYDLIKERSALNKKNVPISVNFSRVCFYDNANLEKTILREKNVSKDDRYINIEITESFNVPISDYSRNCLKQLQDLGTKLYLDDYGTGYSSLLSIVELNIDIVKIDQSLIRRLNDENVKTIVKNTINTLHELNRKVVCEGVETKEQYEFLKECKCDYIQGYYFSKPVPEDIFKLLLDKQFK